MPRYGSQPRSQKSNSYKPRVSNSYSMKYNKNSGKRKGNRKLNPEEKLALKMGPEYIPDYYHDQGDFKGEWYDRESLGFYRSIKAGLDMGIVNQIPVREGLSSTLKPNHLRNPHDLLQKAIEDNNEQRHYQLNGHNKQHLFGKGNQSMISPRKQEFYKDTNFEMENEVYPTEFIKKKNAQLGNN